MSSFYSKDSVMVDETRFVVGTKTVPINNIASVDMHKHYNQDIAPKDFNIKFFLTALAVAGLMLLIAQGSLVLIFVALLSGIAGWFFSKGRKEEGHDSYSVRITTSAGEADSYTLLESTEIQLIVDAINNAVIARG